MVCFLSFYSLMASSAIGHFMATVKFWKAFQNFTVASQTLSIVFMPNNLQLP
jgi:hypothetical protein